MSENDSAGSRTAFLACIQRFTNTMVDRLNEASKEKDVDEKETPTLRNVVLKLLRIWEKALPTGQHDPRLEGKLRAVKKQVPETKSKEE